MTTVSIVLYPLTIRTSKDDNSTKSSIQGVVSNNTDTEWNKLIAELKKCFKTYESIYGIKGSDINRYKNKFVKCNVKIINKNLFKKYEEKHNFAGVIASFINHDLNSGGYPSYYKDGILENKYLYFIKEYIVVETKKIE